MSGIFGVISKKRQAIDHKIVCRMAQSMIYEDELSCSFVFEDQIGIGCGSVYYPDSYASLFPVTGETGSTTLLFTGENIVDTKEQFTNTPKRMVADFEKSTKAFMRNLNGHFSGLGIDRISKTVTIFTDRFSIKRLYTYENDEYVYLASEIKALLAVLPECRTLDSRSVADYINFDCILDNRSIFTGIRMMSSSSYCKVQDGRIYEDHYFSPEEWENQPKLDIADTELVLDECFRDVFSKYFYSNKDLSIALTGGLDTRMLLSNRCYTPGAIHCFTYGNMYRDSLDVSIARKVAEQVGQQHSVIKLDLDYLNDFDTQSRRSIYISDGLANICNLDEVHMNRIVRKTIAPLKITGSYGSQVMRGLVGFRPRYTENGLLKPEFLQHVQDSQNNYQGPEDSNQLSFFLFTEIPWYWSSFKACEFSQLDTRNPYVDYDIIEMLYRVPERFHESGDYQIGYILRNAPQLADIISDKGMLGKRGVSTSLKRSLYKSLGIADKIYSWDKLPANMTHVFPKIDKYFVTPFSLHHLFRGRGYFRYYRTWFQNELKSWVKNLAFSEKTLSRPYWSADYVRSRTQRHLNNTGNYMIELKKVLSLELIQQELIENIEIQVDSNPAPNISRYGNL